MIKLCVSDRVDVFSINHIIETTEGDTEIQLPNLVMYVMVNIDDKYKCEDLEILSWRPTEKLKQFIDIVKWISSDINIKGVRL